MTEGDIALRSSLKRAFEFAQGQVRALLEKYPADYYPMYTVGGKFGQDTKRWTHWCHGFYLGFMFFSTYLRWKGLGGPAERIDPVLIQAGKTMAMRFREKGQYLRSFVEPASLFIDIMMNVGPIFHAGNETGDRHLLAVAHRHCETSRRVLVRGDGSTAHEALFDLETGECLRQSTHQGWRGDSCWSRGLAWSLYGFTRSYRQTGRAEYLQTAEANAAYYLANLPADGV